MIQRHRCPICEQEFDHPESPAKSFFPFCSDRCRMVDLCRWSDGRYAVVEQLDPQVVDLLREDPNIHIDDLSE
jgi:endogenous inhibitor of DNA gyrase (YacG/DUF329 family)